MGEELGDFEAEMTRGPLLMGKNHDGVVSRLAVTPYRAEMTVALPPAGITRASETTGGPDVQRENIQDGTEEVGGSAAAQNLTAAGGDGSDDGSGHGFREEGNDKKENDSSDDGSEEGSTTTHPSVVLNMSSSSQSSSEDSAVPDRNTPDDPETRRWVVDQYQAHRPFLTPLPEGFTVEMRIAEHLNILDAETTALAQRTGRMGNGIDSMYHDEIIEDDEQLF